MQYMVDLFVQGSYFEYLIVKYKITQNQYVNIILKINMGELALFHYILGL